MVSEKIKICLICGIAVISGTCSQSSAAPPSRRISVYIDPLSNGTERLRVLSDLASHDPAKVAAAVSEIHDCATIKDHARTDDLSLFITAGRFDDLEKAAIDGILINASTNLDVAGYEKMRVIAFLAANHPQKALGAAKAYFNTANLIQTSSAMGAVKDALLANCDATKANHFMDEQTASIKNSATQPVSPSVLASVKINEPRLQSMTPKFRVYNYDRYMQRGNLLLATGHADEARQVFLDAIKIVPPRQLSHAIENLARAVRAQTGFAGTADAYLVLLSQPGSAKLLGGRFDDKTVATAAAQIAQSDHPNIVRLQALAGSDESLSVWLTDWAQTALPCQPASEAQIANLEKTLKTTKVTCQNLIDIGDLVQPFSDDFLVAEFYSAAVYAGDKRLQSLDPGSAAAKRVVLLMRGTVGLQWRLIDGENNRRFIPTLLLLNRDAIYWISPDDVEARDTRRWAQLEVAECLYMMGKSNDAAREAATIDNANMTELMRGKVAWIYALSLTATNQPLKAIPELLFLAHHPNLENSLEARGMLIDALVRNDRERDALPYYEALKQEGHEDVISYLSERRLSALQEEKER